MHDCSKSAPQEAWGPVQDAETTRLAEQIKASAQRLAIHSRNTTDEQDTPAITSIIVRLGLENHPEGGFFRETHRDELRVPSPYTTKHTQCGHDNTGEQHGNKPFAGDESKRNASTTIHYLLSARNAIGHLHKNRSTAIHSLHWGRAAYVLIHPPAPQASPNTLSTDNEGGGEHERQTLAQVDKVKRSRGRLETFVVGHNIAAGEKLQWIVPGGVWKGSFLLPDVDADSTSTSTSTSNHGIEAREQAWTGSGASEQGSLITETVVPGFEFCDHEFLSADLLLQLVGSNAAQELSFMLIENEQTKLASELGTP